MAVRKFEVTGRRPYADGREFGATGAFEQIDGIMHFAVDPDHSANARIVDLDLAPRDADGQVRFESDFSMVTPAISSNGNGRALVELPNRGRCRLVPVLNRAPANAPLTQQVHPGDGFLFERGFTIASIGWQWDVFRSDVLLGLEAPVAMRDGVPLGGECMVEIRPSQRMTTWLLADRVHRPLTAAPGKDDLAVLFVRDYEDGEDTVVAKSSWRFAKESAPAEVESSREHIHLDGGFEPGKIYQLVYRTDRAPLAGAGLLALRDVAPFLREPSADNPVNAGFRALYAWGVSQTGRMLRDFIHLGLNQTEAGGLAYDGIQAHVAGARRGSFNHRFAQPSNQTTPMWGHVFPYADVATTDPVTGKHAGLLDRQSELGALPKIISTNSAAEYWRGDAALAHVEPSASEDLPEAPCARSYLFASTQHGAGYLGQSRRNAGVNTVARCPLNVIDYRPLLRAALMNLDAWVAEGIEPPPSQHPRLKDGTAVRRDEIVDFYASLPGFTPPDANRLPFVRTVDMGADEAHGVGRFPAIEGDFYPALVSAIDADGNELAGIRLPDISVPVGSHAGWNSRDPDTGSPDQIVPMNGLSLFFPANKMEREASGDPRLSVAERYASRESYEEQVRGPRRLGSSSSVTYWSRTWKLLWLRRWKDSMRLKP